MKSEASGITGRPRRRVRFWSAKACEGRAEGKVNFLDSFKGKRFISQGGTEKR